MDPLHRLSPSASPLAALPSGRAPHFALGACLVVLLASTERSRAAESLVWTADGDGWFDTDNWDPHQIPGAFDLATVNANVAANRSLGATLRPPDADILAQYYTGGAVVNGNHYRLYTVKNLAAANDGGLLSYPVLDINLSGTFTDNGTVYGYGLRTEFASIGKNTVNGRLDFHGGLWQTRSLGVGDNAAGYFNHNGGILVADGIGVGDGLYDMNSLAKVYTDTFSVSSGDARLKTSSSTLTISKTLLNQYGGSIEVSGSSVDIGASSNAGTAYVFYNDADSYYRQTGGAVTVHGEATMSGYELVDGSGVFTAASTVVSTGDMSDYGFHIADQGRANLGDLKLGYNTSAGLVAVTGAGSLQAATLSMGQSYSLDEPVNDPASEISVSGAGSVAQVSGAVVVGGPTEQTPEPSKRYGSPGRIRVDTGGSFTAPAVSLSQSKTGTGMIQTFTGGKVNISGVLAVGDGPVARGRLESYDSGSEIAANQIWIGKNPGSTGVAYASNGGALRAPDTVLLGPLTTGVSDASLVIGGANPAGGFFGPGPVISPSILKAGTADTNTRVIFQHAATAYTFDPRLQYVDLVTSTGPGRTSLAGRIWDTGVVQATAGTLEIRHGAVANTTGYLIAQNSGTVEINGATVKTPNSGLVTRTLAGAVGTGTITVMNAGRLESSILLGGSGTAANRGTLNVQGTNSTVLVQTLPLQVGSGKTGKLNITAGGRLTNNTGTSSSSAVLGDTAPGIGDAIVSGNGSRWDVGSLTLGNQGRGTALVTSGGTLAAGSITLGNAAGSTASLSIGAGSRATVSATTLVNGNGGQGRISLTEGGGLTIGPTGQGDLVLRGQSSGSGVLDIGSGTATPGVLAARSVYSGVLSGRDVATVRISHQAPAYTLSPLLNELELRIASGNTGVTTLTAPGSFLSYCSVTSGGLRLAQGGRVDMDSTLVVGDGGTIDLDNYSLPFLEIDGSTSRMSATSGLLVGKVGDGEIRLKNGGTLVVRDTTRQAQNSVILGDDTTTLGRTCSVVFGGSPTTAPGVLDATGIQSYATTGKVIFNHSTTGYTLAANLGGTLAVQHQAGITLLTGGLGYTGSTSVTGGTLLVNSPTSSVVTVSGGATFGGRGTVARVNLNSGSILSPGTFRSGETISSQRITALNFFGGSKVQIDLGPNLTCDKILNHNAGAGATTFFPVTSGNITFDFRNQGMNQSGVYPVLTTTDPISTSFMNRLLFTANFPLQGSFRQTRITGDPQSANAYTQLEFVVTSFGNRPAYEIWAQDTYGLNLATTGAVDADPDGDGVQNMLEFVLGSSPVSPIATRLPQASVAGDALKFSFNRRLLLQGYFTTAVEYSTDLVNWTTAPVSMLFIGPADDQGFEPVTYTIPLPPGATRLFGRLRVTQVAP